MKKSTGYLAQKDERTFHQLKLSKGLPGYLRREEPFYCRGCWSGKLDEDVTYRNSKGYYFPGDLYFYEPEQKYYIVAGTDLMNKPVRLMTIEAEKVDTYYKYNNLSNVPSKADVTMVYQTRDRVNKNLQQINLPSLPVNAKLAFKEKGQNALNYIDFSGGSFRYSILGNSSSVQGYNIHRAYDLKNGTLVK